MKKFSGNKKNKNGEETAKNANASNPRSLPRPSGLGASASASFPANAPQSILTTDSATLGINTLDPANLLIPTNLIDTRYSDKKGKNPVTSMFRKPTSKQGPSAQVPGSSSATVAQPPIPETTASPPLEGIKSPKFSIFKTLTSPFNTLRKSFEKTSTDTSNPNKESKNRWSLTKTTLSMNKKDNDAVANLDSSQLGNKDDLEKENIAIEKVASSDSAKQSQVSGLFDSPHITHEFKHIEKEEVSMLGHSAKKLKKGEGKGKGKGKGKGQVDENEIKQITAQTTQDSNEENKASESSLVEKSGNESSQQTQQDENFSDVRQHNESVATDEKSNSAEKPVENEETKQEGSFLSIIGDVFESEYQQTKQELSKESSEFKSNLHSNFSKVKEDVTTKVSSLLSSGLDLIVEKEVNIKQTHVITKPNDDDSMDPSVTSTEDVTQKQESAPKNIHRRNQSTDSSLHFSGLGIIEETGEVDKLDSTITENVLVNQKDEPIKTYYSMPRPKLDVQSTEQSFNNGQTNKTNQQEQNKKPRVNASASQQPKDEPKSLFQRFIAGIGAAFSAVGAALYSLVKPIINLIWPEKDHNENESDNNSEFSQEPDSNFNYDDSDDNDNNSMLKKSNTITFSKPTTDSAKKTHVNTDTETKKPSKGFGCSIL